MCGASAPLCLQAGLFYCRCACACSCERLGSLAPEPLTCADALDEHCPRATWRTCSAPVTPATRTIPCEAIATSGEFRHLSSINGLRYDLKYASADNFMSRDMYAPLDCAWLHHEAAAALESVIAALAQQRPVVTLCVLDALRPQRVQQAMWDALAGTPLTQYLAPPEIGSIHSFGMAVDVTLLDAHGEELDMGTPFDDMSELSHPVLEGGFVASGDLRSEHLAHRHLLRNAMLHAGFHAISTEWWHFDLGDRAHVRRTFARVL